MILCRLRVPTSRQPLKVHKKDFKAFENALWKSSSITTLQHLG